jgi:hypothetical protein
MPFLHITAGIYKEGSSWNRVGKIGVSGRAHARARKRGNT